LFSSSSSFLTLDLTYADAHCQHASMWKPSVLLAAALSVPAHALHFYMDGAVQKCFYEELPKDTLVVGEQPWHGQPPHYQPG